jgi:hypothetical protein
MKSYESFSTKKKIQDSLYRDVTLEDSYEQQHKEILQHSKAGDTSDIVSNVAFSGCYNEIVVPDFHKDTNAEREEPALIRGKYAIMKLEDVLNPMEIPFEDNANSLRPFIFHFQASRMKMSSLLMEQILHKRSMII